MIRHQRTVDIACALAATCLGLVYLTSAGAPASLSMVNGSAFLIGIVALVAIGAAMPLIRRYPGPLLLVMASSLLVTALVGEAADGAARWILIGPLSVQVSLVLVPFMAVTFARYPTPAGCLGIAIAALALALQPDRGMAGVLAFGMAVLAITRPSRLSASALVVALAAFLVSIIRPDTLPAIAYVDQILFTAFDIHLLAGVAVWLGALLLLVPAILGWRSSEGLGHAYLVFGAVWLGCIVAAASGNYPTPVVGYGGSAILGYLLALACLSPGARSADDTAAVADEECGSTVLNATEARLWRRCSIETVAGLTPRAREGGSKIRIGGTGMKRMMLSLALAGLLTSACSAGSGETVSAENESADRTAEGAPHGRISGPVGKNGVPADRPALLLDSEGVSVAGETQGRLAFGANSLDTVEAVSALLGTGFDRNESQECGAGAMEFANWGPVVLMFQTGEFVGWELREASDRPWLGTPGGATIGTGRGDLRAGLGEEPQVEESTIGIEFHAAGYSGLLSADGPDGRVTALWAGTNCIMR